MSERGTVNLGLGLGAARAIVEAVRAVARAEIVPRFRALAEAEIEAKSGPGDLVTLADRRAEAALADALRTILPGAAIVGEEAVAEGRASLDPVADAETCAVIDPIDGTWNYAHGLGAFGVIVAVLRRGEPAFGLLHDPLADDWVAASAGGGAWHHRPGRPARRLSMGAAVPLETARGAVDLAGFPPAERARVATGLAGLGHSATLGCSCHEYRLLAMGRLRFVVAAEPMPWDHAAGVLAAREAGGCALTPAGTPHRPAARATLVVADTAANAERLTEVLALAGR